MFWFIRIAGLAAALFIPIVNVLVATIIQTVLPLEFQGCVNSVNLALVTAATPIGIITSGIAVAYVCASHIFVGCAATGIIAITLAWLFTGFRHFETN